MLRELNIDPRRFVASDRRWWEAYVRGEVTLEELRRNRWRDFGLEGESAVRADEAYRATARAVNLRTGARRLLRRLRGLGLRTAILTNGAVEPQWWKIERVGLAPLVDAVLITEAVGYHKPDERAFVAALTEIDTPPGAAAMVGDTLESDVEGALRAGLDRVVWLTRRGSHGDRRVVPVRRLDDVVPALLEPAPGGTA